uniref:DAO domain-containing protein n=1 Tax=Steinernema glaseri TaxID=37863 RepID=A0A1I8AVP2_9BILA
MAWNVCVIGAGINGLAVARELQRRFGRDIKLTIVTDKKTPETTSDVAAGLWMPHLVNGENAELLKKWAAETYEHIAELDRKSPDSGAFLCSGYTFDNTPTPPDFAESIYHSFRRLSASEIQRLGFSDFKYGNFYTTYFLEPSIYLRKLMKEFREEGGELLEKKLESVDDLLPGRFDLIVNCAGLGSRYLFGDEEVLPIRGHVIRAKCPSMKHFYIFNGQFHCFPNSDTVVLGGTKDKGDFDLSIRASDTQLILSETLKYLPQLKKAEIVQQRVGLRPFRKAIRLELERFQTKSGITIPIVHNYGHGGSGITMFYGCSKAAADLVEAELLHTSKL